MSYHFPRSRPFDLQMQSVHILASAVVKFMYLRMETYQGYPGAVVLSQEPEILSQKKIQRNSTGFCSKHMQSICSIFHVHVCVVLHVLIMLHTCRYVIQTILWNLVRCLTMHCLMHMLMDFMTKFQVLLTPNEVLSFDRLYSQFLHVLYISHANKSLGCDYKHVTWTI